MNSITPYEEAIAQKLDSLPVPDMVDSIWLRIEMELHAPLAPANKPVQPKPHNNIWYGAIGTVVLTVAIILYYYNQKSEPAAVAPIMPAPTEKVIPVIDSSAVPTQAIPINKSAPPPVKKDTSIHVAPVSRIDFNAVDKVNTAPTQPDSLGLNGNQLPPLRITPLKTDIPANKPKGVKGITENDYRVLSSKKDSVKTGGQ